MLTKKKKKQKNTNHTLKLTTTISSVAFSARRYASAVYAVVVCLSVRPSVTSRCCIEKTGRIELVFGMKASFHLSHTVL